MNKIRSRIVLSIIFSGLILFLPAREAFSGGIMQATEVVEDEDGAISLISNTNNSSSVISATNQTVLVTVTDNKETTQFYIDEGFAYEATDEDLYYIENSVKEKRIQLASPIKGSESPDNSRRHGFLKSLALEARLGSAPDSRVAIVPSNVLTSTNNNVAGYNEAFTTEMNLPDAMGIHSSIVASSYLMDGSGATLRGPPMLGVLP